MGWRDRQDMYHADDRLVIESGNAKALQSRNRRPPLGEQIYPPDQ